MIRVEFAGNRIGRRHDQDPVDLDVADLDTLAVAVHDHVRQHLLDSREVVLDPGDRAKTHGTGFVLCGPFSLICARFRFHTLPGGTP